jgi:hypothetical protein
MKGTKQTNFRLPEITRQQIEEIRQRCGYATATDVVVVAVDRMRVAFDYGRPGGDCTVKMTTRLKSDGTTEVVSVEHLPAYRDGEPCNHPGCLSHVTHPCEGCGRIAGKAIDGNYILKEPNDADK